MTGGKVGQVGAQSTRWAGFQDWQGEQDFSEGERGELVRARMKLAM